MKYNETVQVVFVRLRQSLHRAGLLLVCVEQVRFEVGARHFESRAPFATEGALQVVTVCHGKHALLEQYMYILLLILQYF